MEDKQILEDLEINNEELTKLDKVELELQEVEVLIDQLDMKLSVEVSDDLLEEYNKIGSLNLKLNISRKEMAELLGVPRPSLSREMIKMKEEGLIDFNKNVIKILDEEALEDVLI